jgi:oligopeptide/dipeptide ABC transporter ATP-binding protein
MRSVAFDDASDGAREHILKIEGLAVTFAASSWSGGSKKNLVHAVNGIDIVLRRGETLGLVGESGSGKSTTGRAVLGLVPPTSGRVEFLGHDLAELSHRQLRRLRRRMQLIPQDPSSSLNPMMKVGRLISEPMDAHRLLSRSQRRQRVVELLGLVGLPAEAAAQYPREFSGGQRQRIAIARALALDPALVVCDEPTSALDVSIRAEILDLLKRLQERTGVAYLFISHDLETVSRLATSVAVLYCGELIEGGSTDRIFKRPLHPYTQALLAATPVADPAHAPLPLDSVIHGEPPNARELPTGCTFHPRCPYAKPRCITDVPEAEDVGDGAHVSCHFWRDIARERLPRRQSPHAAHDEEAEPFLR